MHSPTLDEPALLLAGLSHWQFGRFELYRVNPPLTRMIAAIPVLIAGYEGQIEEYSDGPGARPEFRLGRDFVSTNGPRSIKLFFLARCACIPISIVGAMACFHWSREMWGNDLAGYISVLLWSFDPNILAHGSLITTDCSAAAFGVCAGYFFWRWYRCPGLARALVAGLFVGLAVSSKFTWLILFVLLPMSWITCGLIGHAAINKRRKITSRECYELALILSFALFVINMVYSFDGSFSKLKEFVFVSESMRGTTSSGNRFIGRLEGEIRIPFPRQLVLGVDLQRSDFESTRLKSYLRGEWKTGGWWYYYLYGFIVKTPIGTQLLFILSVASVFRGKFYTVQNGASIRDLILLTAPAIAIVILVSSQTGFNHHFRYVLPSFGFVFVFCGSTYLWFCKLGCSPKHDP